MSDLQTQHTDQEQQAVAFNYLGGPPELEPTLRKLHELISASVASDADYNNIMSELANLNQEAFVLIDLMRQQRDGKAEELSTLEQAIKDYWMTNDERIQELVEMVETETFENIYQSGYGFIADLAESINEMFGFAVDDATGIALARSLYDASDLPNNEAAQQILRDLLANVSGGGESNG